MAAGKGVILPSSKEEAHAGLKDIMLAKEFGSAGDEVVIEEFLEGDEISILSFSDGYTIKSLPCGVCTFRSHSFGGKFGLHTILWKQLAPVPIHSVLSLGRNPASWCRKKFVLPKPTSLLGLFAE